MKFIVYNQNGIINKKFVFDKFGHLSTKVNGYFLPFLPNYNYKIKFTI